MIERYSHCGPGFAVHEEHVKVPGVVDKELLVSSRIHVACLLVGAVTDLMNVRICLSASIPSLVGRHFCVQNRVALRNTRPPRECTQNTMRAEATYVWHGRLTLEPSPHGIINSLRFPPVWLHAFEALQIMSATSSMGKPEVQ